MALTEKLPALGRDKDIIKTNINVSDSFKDYYSNSITANELVVRIEKSVMIQRMLSKAKEIIDQDVKNYGFTKNDGLRVNLKTFSVLDYIKNVLESEQYNYKLKSDVLCAADFGVPQKRMRFVMIGIKKDICSDFEMPVGILKPNEYHTVKDAIFDLENIPVINNVHEDIGTNIQQEPQLSDLARQLRNTNILYNHIVTATREAAQKRFDSLEQGQNFHNLSDDLKTNTYTDTKRTQNTIYLRLLYNQPSGTVVNVRKSMWIHPTKNRAVSIREAARLQSFPDNFKFIGTKDSQYQQVGNAVPPILAEAIAEHLANILKSEGENDG